MNVHSTLTNYRDSKKMKDYFIRNYEGMYYTGTFKSRHKIGTSMLR